METKEFEEFKQKIERIQQERKELDDKERAVCKEYMTRIVETLKTEKNIEEGDLIEYRNRTYLCSRIEVAFGGWVGLWARRLYDGKPMFRAGLIIQVLNVSDLFNNVKLIKKGK